MLFRYVLRRIIRRAVAYGTQLGLKGKGQPEPERKRFTREVHPDLVEALAAAEDTLSAAFGQPVKVRPRGDGCRVEVDFDSPGEAVELAERILSRAHLRAV